MFLHVLAGFYMSLHAFTCFGQKSGRPIFEVFVKHVVELYSLVKTDHLMFPQDHGPKRFLSANIKNNDGSYGS